VAEGRADEVLTEKLMVVLRDGRKLIGVLRSWDQFGMHLASHCGFPCLLEKSFASFCSNTRPFEPTQQT
jgi:hypothetical protein